MTPSTGPMSWWWKALDRASVPFALLFLYVVLLFSLVTFLDIVSPTLVEEDSTIIFVSIVCALLVVTPPVLVPTFLEKLRTVPGYAREAPNTDAAVAPIILNLRIRSRLFKLGAVSTFLLIIGTTLLGFTVAGAPQSEEAVTETGVTALVLLLFFLRTLASIYRHNMRLASFYDSRADYLQAGGRTKDLKDKDLLNLFSTEGCDLGWTERLSTFFRSRQQSEKPQS